MKPRTEPDNQRDIDGVGNYYGGLSIAEAEGNYWWTIEDWDGQKWEPIPKYLYDALNKYQDEHEN